MRGQVHTKVKPPFLVFSVNLLSTNFSNLALKKRATSPDSGFDKIMSWVSESILSHQTIDGPANNLTLGKIMRIKLRGIQRAC